MQFSASLSITFAAYAAAASINGTISPSIVAPIVTVVQPPITQTISTFVTYCPSPTAFQVGNISYTVTTATLLTIVCPTNGCPTVNSVQLPTAAPMAPYSNTTAPFRNGTAPAQCPNAANGQGSSGYSACPAVAGKVSLIDTGASNNGSAGASGANAGASGASRTSNGCSTGASGANTGASGASGASSISNGSSTGASGVNAGASEGSSASNSGSTGASSANSMGFNAGGSGSSRASATGSSGASTTGNINASSAGGSASNRLQISGARKLDASIVALVIVAATASAL